MRETGFNPQSKSLTVPPNQEVDQNLLEERFLLNKTLTFKKKSRLMFDISCVCVLLW